MENEHLEQCHWCGYWTKASRLIEHEGGCKVRLRNPEPKSYTQKARETQVELPADIERIPVRNHRINFEGNSNKTSSKRVDL